jgi:hypothetical protein
MGRTAEGRKTNATAEPNTTEQLIKLRIDRCIIGSLHQWRLYLADLRNSLKPSRIVVLCPLEGSGQCVWRRRHTKDHTVRIINRQTKRITIFVYRWSRVMCRVACQLLPTQCIHSTKKRWDKFVCSRL